MRTTLVIDGQTVTGELTEMVLHPPTDKDWANRMQRADALFQIDPPIQYFSLMLNMEHDDENRL